MINNQQFPQPQGAEFAPVVIRASGHSNAIKIVLGTTAALIGLLLGLLVLLLIGVETGPVALLVGMICATIPVPIYVMLVLWIDRYESEPMWMLCTTFFWGAMVAVFVAFIFNTASVVFVGAVTQNVQAGETFAAVISAPIVEEGAKALILFIFFFWKKDEFDGVIDGIVYASLVALGFAMTENFQYYGKAALHGTLTGTIVIRGFMAPFSHPLFTSMTGIGLGLSRQSKNMAVKFIAPVMGLTLAMLMHAIWNGSGALFGGLAFLLTYVVVMVPAFLILLVVIIFSLRREGRLVREFLLPDFQRGLLTQEEYNQLASVWQRLGASTDSLTRGGIGKWRVCMQLNQTGSELAFHRSRVARGIFKSEQAAREREAGYVQVMQDLLQRLRTT
jgi:RsiW-degrading membrane proteinase PrsW (M82 family)